MILHFLPRQETGTRAGHTLPTVELWTQPIEELAQRVMDDFQTLQARPFPETLVARSPRRSSRGPESARCSSSWLFASFPSCDASSGDARRSRPCFAPFLFRGSPSRCRESYCFRSSFSIFTTTSNAQSGGVAPSLGNRRNEKRERAVRQHLTRARRRAGALSRICARATSTGAGSASHRRCSRTAASTPSASR